MLDSRNELIAHTNLFNNLNYFDTTNEDKMKLNNIAFPFNYYFCVKIIL